ncbi:MAG: hypothetical protein NT020_05085 [Chloroflexales bacterium]|nr:hypothetical protein [Chloroflexales bacterium]
MTHVRRLLVSSLLLVVLLAGSVSAVFAADNAYAVNYVTSITYMNVGSDAANLSVTFYNAADGTTTDYPLLNSNGSAVTIPVKASSSIAVSAVSGLSSTWKGGAVISSNQPLIATMVQISNDTVIKVRPVSNGFQSTDGSGTIIVPTVMKACFNDKLTTRFNVQNVGSGSNTATVTIKWPNGDTAKTITTPSLAPGAVYAVDMGTVSPDAPTNAYTIPTGCTFNGSAVITSASNIVASALETSTINKYANSFEGFKGTTSDGAPKIYMPSAMCKVNYGEGEQSSAYAVQNLTASQITIAVVFTYQLRTNGVLGTVSPAPTVTLNLTIPANSKASVPGCHTLRNSVGNTIDATGSGMPDSSIGSAVITSTGGNIVAISKVIGAGLTTATPGIMSGGTAVNVPFVRYSTKCYLPTVIDLVCQGASRQRTLFAVQNVGTSAATVVMTLYNQNGVSVGTYTTPSIPAGGKVSVSPTNATITGATNATAFSEFGYWCPAITDAQTSCTITYAGSASFTTSTSAIAVIARVMTMSPLGPSGDDYNGIPE